MYNLFFSDYINIILINIQPLRGWRVGEHISHRLHLWLLSRSANYCVSHSTPTGLARRGAHFPQVAPVAIHIQPLRGWRVGEHISHRLHLWLFTFNPYGVGALGAHFPQVAPVAIHIQPLRGWHFDNVSTKSAIIRVFPLSCTSG